ncbi:hypothetical protein LEP1GSC056_0286 [Leptospira borgpetersenii str. Brem 328]|uniref:SLEI domain protein, PF07620 family n=1 Tax=Leptospira borgpetersenii str. Brem 328 TaxID=1049780 RepID=A0ABC9SJC3_LEPBO|nr:hypothetical protein LEP1GSC056_0286 [Leptospira borgpetersenii str. Brem 328]
MVSTFLKSTFYRNLKTLSYLDLFLFQKFPFVFRVLSNVSIHDQRIASKSYRVKSK